MKSYSSTRRKRSEALRLAHTTARSRPAAAVLTSIIVDRCDAPTLRSLAARDPNIPKDHLANIETVDFVGSAVDIGELVGVERFDYVLSSHNLEHLPDPIRFLQGCESVLNTGGMLSMAIPDRRCCFDYFRPVTTLAEWLEAYSERRKKPTPAQMFRQASMSSLRGDQFAWSLEDFADGIAPEPAVDLDATFAAWRGLTDGSIDGYCDTHCWAFTPASFQLMLEDLRYLGLLRLEPVEIYGPNGCEFYVHLRNPSSPANQQDRSSFYARRSEIMHRMMSETVAPVMPVVRVPTSLDVTSPSAIFPGTSRPDATTPAPRANSAKTALIQLVVGAGFIALALRTLGSRAIELSGLRGPRLIHGIRR